jgi:hypothetical protein
VVCFDRNFPGHDLNTALLDAGGHVIARVKAGIALRSGCPRLVIQEAWARLTGTQLTRASAAVSLDSEHAAARAQRRPAGHGRRGILHRRLAPRRPLLCMVDAKCSAQGNLGDVPGKKAGHTSR